MLDKTKFELRLNEKFLFEFAEGGKSEEFLVTATGGFNSEEVVDCVVLEDKSKSKMVILRKIYEPL